MSGEHVIAAPAVASAGRRPKGLRIDLRWAAIVAVLMAASGWIGFVVGQHAHP